EHVFGSQVVLAELSWNSDSCCVCRRQGHLRKDIRKTLSLLVKTFTFPMQKSTDQELAILSTRGSFTTNFYDFLCSYMSLCAQNPFSPEHNEKGIINMGTAVNRLMEKELTERLNKDDILKYNSSFQHYYDFSGSEELRNAVAGFFTRHLCPENPVDSNNLVVMNGVTSCLDSLAHTLCDPGDVIITPTPVYGRIFTDFSDRSGVTVMPLHLSEKPNSDGISFFLDHTMLESRIQEVKSKGQSVRAFILLHPHNPLGDVYSHEHIRKLMHVCARYQIHFISDEIYALSVFAEGTKHSSVLAMKDIPDPQRTHVLWGFSKTFSIMCNSVGGNPLMQVILITCIRDIPPTILPSLGDAAHNIMNIRGILPTILPALGGCHPQYYLHHKEADLSKTYNKCYTSFLGVIGKLRKTEYTLFMVVFLKSFVTS
ncbi:unnamed protein product, partial [Meganyctiphanes norvegica]